MDASTSFVLVSEGEDEGRSRAEQIEIRRISLDPVRMVKVEEEEGGRGNWMIKSLRLEEVERSAGG